MLAEPQSRPQVVAHIRKRCNSKTPTSAAHPGVGDALVLDLGRRGRPAPGVRLCPPPKKGPQVGRRVVNHDAAAKNHKRPAGAVDGTLVRKGGRQLPAGQPCSNERDL